eukprot:SAG31_NODE_39931_length_284_cov_1.075676_1_plen_94_part_11
MAVELRNAIADAVGQPMPATLLFDYPMVTAIAEYLLKDVLIIEDAHASAGIITQDSGPAAARRQLTDTSLLAIVGMSCRFADGGNSAEDFWDNL